MKPRWWLVYNNPERGDVQVPFTTYAAAADFKAMCERSGFAIVSLTCEDPTVRPPLRKNTDESGPCLWCGRFVTDQSEEAGAPEDSSPAWATADGDYGCDDAPDAGEDGCGAHVTMTDVRRWYLSGGKS